MTALFADIVGSTSLAEHLSPDEVKVVIGECVSRMSRVVEEFGATVGAYMGDGIAGFFGIPFAHEDDPKRAAQASLRILDVIDKYSRDVEAAWGVKSFGVRIGINSGMAGVGLVGSAQPREVALGDSVNVAARLQSLAEPGTAIVGTSTASRIGSAFSLKPLGELRLRGREEPVVAWRLLGPHLDGEESFATPLVDREGERVRLIEVVDQLISGRGGILTLVGEPGIGKTRLLAELRQNARGSVTWLQARCLPYGSGQLLGPFVQVLRSWLSTAEGTAEVAVRTRLRARLTRLTGEHAEEIMPFLGFFLSIDTHTDHEESVRKLSSESFAWELRRAYSMWIRQLANQGPVVLAIDDLHWADKPTRELAEELLEVTDEVPLLFAATLRPEPETEGWRLRLKALGHFGHRATDLRLPPLPDPAARDLVNALAPATLVDESARESAVQRAEGNPLFLEELLRALTEQVHWDLPAHPGSPSGSLSLTPALHSLLVSRIDRLPVKARRMIQIAAVIGRTFPLRLLERVVEERNYFEDGLKPLLRADFVRELRRAPEPEFIFRHGLYQDAALSTLTGPQLRLIHARVAQGLEEEFASRLDDFLEALAHHYVASSDRERAVVYLDQAANRAASIHANAQAIDLWERALEVAPQSSAEIKGRMAERMAEVCARTGQFARAAHLYSKLARESEDTAEKARLTSAEASVLFVSGSLAACRRAIERGLSLTPAASIRAVLLRLRAYVAVRENRYPDAREVLESLEETDSEELDLSADLGVDLATLWMGYSTEVGDWAAAEQWGERRLRTAEEALDEIRVINAKADLGTLKLMTGELGESLELLGDAYQRATECGYVIGRLMTGNNLLFCCALSGRLRGSEELAYELEPYLDSVSWKSAVLGSLGLCLFELGSLEAARSCLVRALENGQEAGAEAPSSIDAALLLAAIRIEEGDLTVEAQLRESLSEANKIEGRYELHILGHRLLAEFYLKTTRLNEAMVEGLEALKYEQRAMRPVAVPARRVLGLVREESEQGSGRPDLMLALEMARSMGMRLEEGRALFALVKTRLSSDPSADLQRAREIFMECGARRDLAELSGWEQPQSGVRVG